MKRKGRFNVKLGPELLFWVKGQVSRISYLRIISQVSITIINLQRGNLLSDFY